MEDQTYDYSLKPLVQPGLTFLIAYPLVVGALYLFRHFSSLELKILGGIYLLSSVLIITLWLVGKSKKVTVTAEQIVFCSLMGKRILEPLDIRKILLRKTKQGEEIVQISTKRNEYFYLNDFYFPFPELMSSLEEFISINTIKSNI